MFTAAFSQQYY